jgi:mono/diheme cytochrome c family protein
MEDCNGMNRSQRFCIALTVGLALFALTVLISGSRTYAGTETSVASPSDAKTTFDAKCAKCHGKDGRAKGLLSKAKGVRNLTDAKWQEDVADERLFNSISNGRGKMPSFKKKLSEADINALVAYVRSLKK